MIRKRISTYRKIPQFGKYTRDDVKAYFSMKLYTDKEFQLKVLNVLAKFQTDYEIHNGVSDCENNLGFTKFDAYPLTRIWKLSKKNKLMASHYEKLKELLPKYALQVASLAKPENWIEKIKEYLGD